MKTFKQKFEIIFLCLLTISAVAQDDLITRSRAIEKVYDVGSQGGLSILNNFGDINIHKWDQNQIKLVITTKVIAWNEKDADYFLDNLIKEPEILKTKEGQKFVYSAFNVQHIKNFCCPGEKKVYSKWFDKRAEVKHFSIDYEVYVPESLSFLQINLAYGNASLGNFKGKVMIRVKNGDLKTGILDLETGWNPITVSYGKVNISEVNHAELKFYSCDEVNIGTLEKSKMDSDFSKLQINKCDDLSLQSKSDNFRIETVGSLTGKADFTTFQIRFLQKQIGLESLSGSILIENIDPGFEKINLRGQFNDYEISLPKNNYSIYSDIEFTILDCPAFIYNCGTTKDESQSKIVFNKKVGEPLFGKSEIKLNCSNCKIILDQKNQ